jgi:hypothetical protein
MDGLEPKEAALQMLYLSYAPAVSEPVSAKRFRIVDHS